MPVSKQACPVQLQLLPPQLNSPHSKIQQPGQRPRHRETPQLPSSLPTHQGASSGQRTLQQAGRLERQSPQRLNLMCKSRPVPINPEKMGDNIYGISSHVSFIDHLDIGLSSVTGGRCPAPPDPRRPVCLSQRHLLEDNPRQALHPPPKPPDLSQHDLLAAPVDVDSDQHDGNCPGSQPRA